MPLKKTTNKNSQSDKHGRTNANVAKVSKSSTGTGSTMKMTIASTPTMSQRIHHRKVLRLAGKRLGAHHRSLTMGSGKGRPSIRSSMDHPCENSDDSGLGFDHHMDVRPYGCPDRSPWADEVPDIKRRKITGLKVENEEANDSYCFPDAAKNCKENAPIVRSLPCTGIQSIGKTVSQNSNAARNIGRCLPLVNRRSPVSGPVTLTTQLSSTSRNGKVHLQIVCQPEQQHRARYQTEGSRGAVKDRTGNSFPIVKLNGYDKATTLQIFIGTDLGRVAPHMFYQACRVSGKNSTPCIEKKIDGTIVIEVDLEPAKDMTATCDCVGILKERNVDVEHRFPEQLSPRSKKKSTKCRMVFRTIITNEDGSTETLQVCSQPIVCTQPPGIPEMCKKSLTNCPASGGLELFILGKNFLKDTKVVFQQQAMYETDRSEVIWEEVVTPDKEFLQQTHLVCVVPPYMRRDINEPVSVRLYIVSSGKNSEAHTFIYTPVNPNSATSDGTVGMEGTASTAVPFLSKMLWQTGTPKQEMDLGMMPPPTSLVPLAQRRPSTNQTVVDSNSPPMRSLKTELMDENSQGSVAMEHMINENSLDMHSRLRAMSESSMDVHHDDTNMTMINENSMDFLRRQDLIKKHAEVLNENSNSMHSFHCDKSNHSIHNDESIEPVQTAETRMFAQADLLTAHTLMQSELQASALTRDNMKGIDLRLKNSIAAFNELANTHPPSLATLRRFVITEPTNIPLPTQTGQSVENYLTTLENNVNKAILSNTLANNTVKTESEQLLMQSIKSSSLLDRNPMLSTQLNGQFRVNTQPGSLANIPQMIPAESTITGTNKLFTDGAQVLPETILTATSSSEILPTLNESHLKTNTNFEQNLIAAATSQVIFNPQTTTSSILEATQAEVLKQTDSNLMLSQQNLQAALNVNILQRSAATSKLDALVNSTVETHICSPIKSPQQELLINKKSPLLPSSPQEILPHSPILVSQPPDMLLPHPAAQTVMLNSQSPLLSNELIIHSPPSELTNAHVSPAAISPEVILNPQVSPSVMCRSSQETLLQVSGNLNTICNSNVLQTNQMQQDMITTESANNALLSTLKNPSVCEERIVLNAAVDYLETQKKISEITRMDNHLLQASLEQQKSQEQNLINSLLDVRNNAPSQTQVLLQTTGVSDMFVAGTQTQNILTTMTSGDNKPSTLTTNQYLNQVNLNLSVSPKQESNKSELTLVPVSRMPEQSVAAVQQQTAELKKSEESMIPQTLTNMSDSDLISYINPSCFDQGTFTS